MTGIRVLALLALILGAIVCDAATESKRTVKPTIEPKKVEDRTTKEKRDSSEITTIYAVKQKDEPFRPNYQYQYQGAPLRPTHYVAAASSPQVSYNKPDSALGITSEPLSQIGEGSSNAGTIQYAAITSYKPQGGVQYAPSPFKAPVNAPASRLQYASSAHRGPFVTTYQPASAAEVKVHPVYTPPQPSNHQPQAVSLPLHYGGYEQQLPPPHSHQHQSVYAIAFPPDYVRHYHQNLATPFQMHGTHFVPVVYSSGPVQQPALKEQPPKSAPVHFISLGPHSPAAAASAPVASTLPASGPTVITHIIPLYGHGGHPHQHLLPQAPPLPFFFGAHHQQGPAGIAYTAAASPQQQTIQIAPKHQIFGPIQMAAVGAAGAATTIPIIPFKPIVVAPQYQHLQQQQQQHQQQQYQQQLQQSHHSSGTTYHRYAPSPSVSSSSGNNGGVGGSGNSIEIPSSETGHPTVLKLTQLHSSPASTSNIYSGTFENASGSGGKLSYTYASNANPIGAMYTHPGAVQYGTHLYHPSAKVIEIGGNRVTAGSAAIAGVAPPAYRSQHQSSNSNGVGSGAGSNAGGGSGGSNSVIKFS